MFTTIFIFTPTLDNFRAVLGQEVPEIALEQSGGERARGFAFR